MRGLGYEVSASSVVKLYMAFLDHFVIDSIDKGEADKIRKMGVNVSVTNTVMKSLQAKISLAETTLKALT
jgi:hypothetical protein